MQSEQTGKTANFDAENDPQCEHDCGGFDRARHRFFFKIDRYDSMLAFGSQDPSDPDKTTRVLTIMLAEVYWPPARSLSSPSGAGSLAWYIAWGRRGFGNLSSSTPE